MGFEFSSDHHRVKTYKLELLSKPFCSDICSRNGGRVDQPSGHFQEGWGVWWAGYPVCHHQEWRDQDQAGTCVATIHTCNCNNFFVCSPCSRRPAPPPTWSSSENESQCQGSPASGNPSWANNTSCYRRSHQRFTVCPSSCTTPPSHSSLTSLWLWPTPGYICWKEEGPSPLLSQLGRLHFASSFLTEIYHCPLNHQHHCHPLGTTPAHQHHCQYTSP